MPRVGRTGNSLSPTEGGRGRAAIGELLAVSTKLNLPVVGAQWFHANTHPTKCGLCISGRPDSINQHTRPVSLQIFMGHLPVPRASQVALVVKSLPANAGDVRDTDSIPELGRSPGGGLGNPFQYSCLKNPMDRRAWQAKVHRGVKSQTRLK